jgi:hypothetical protein
MPRVKASWTASKPAPPPTCPKCRTTELELLRPDLNTPDQM